MTIATPRPPAATAGVPPGRHCRASWGAFRKVRGTAKIGEEERLTRPEYEALRGRLRQEKAIPLLKSFGEWLDNQAKLLLPKSPLAEAIGYARNQWAALQVYVTAGFLEIDNNAAERALRPVAVGRKNYLFFGSDVGVKRRRCCTVWCRRAVAWGSSRGGICVMFSVVSPV